MSTLLAGRDPELTQIRATIKQVLAGESVVLRISGEAGIGKSSLLDAIEDEVASEGVRVIRGVGARAEADFPYGLFMAMFEPVFATDRVVGQLDTFEIADLAQAIPGLRRFQPAGAASSLNQVLICRAFRAALDAYAAGSRALILMVDDIQWADSSSFAAIDFLTRHVIATPMLIATASRPTSDLRTVGSDDGSTQMQIADLHLRALPPAAAHGLLAAAPEADRAAIFEAAGGNPFYLTELAAAASRKAPTDAAPFSSMAGTDSVVSVIVSDLHDRSEPAQNLAMVASVIGDPFDMELVVAAAAQQREVAFSALDELIAAKIITVTDRPGVFRFRHPIVARAIYDSLPEGFRLDCHNAAAHVLRQAGAAPIEIAGHVEASAATGDVEAVDTLINAAQEAKRVDARLSARLAKSAIRLIPDHGPLLEKRPTVFRLWVEELVLADESDQAIAELTAEANRPDLDEDARRQLAPLIVYLDGWFGMLGVGQAPAWQELAVKALAWAELRAKDGDPEAMFIGFLKLGTAKQLEQARAAGAQLMAMAEAVDKPEFVFRVRAMLSFWESRLGEAESAISALDDANRTFESLTPELRADAGDSLLLLAAAELRLGNLDRAITYAGTGLEGAERRGNSSTWVIFALSLHFALINAGRIAETAEVLSMAEDRARLLEIRALLAPVLAGKGAAEAVSGTAADAAELLRRAEAHSDLIRHPDIEGDVALHVAWAWMVLGDPRACERDVTQVMESPDFGTLGIVQRTMAFAIACWAAGETGDKAAAAHWSQCASEAADRLVVASQYWELRTKWILAGLEGDAVNAARHAAAAVESARASGRPVEEGIAGIEAGRQLAKSGEHADAVAALVNARTVLLSIGADRLADIAAAELAALGASAEEPPAESDLGPLADLSPRELEIARLVSHGMTSPEVASQLFLSDRTVETHLRRIFRKLGLKNRAELAATVEAHDPQFA